MIDSQIELRHLRYFVALAEHRHFTRAAEAVNITQPTLSQQIRQLEHAFGSLLVDRIGKRVSLTAAGDTLLPHARSVLKQLEDAHAAVGETRGLRSGTLSVAVVQTVNATLLPNLLARFSRRYPGIHVSSRELPGDDLEAGVESGAFDLGIGFCPAGRRGLQTEPLFEEELVVIAPRDHALSKRKEARMSDLAPHPLVLLPRGYCTRELLQAAFANAKVSPRIALEINSIEGILATIDQTGGATVLPSLSLDGKLNTRLKRIRLTHPTPTRTVGLVWRAGAFRKAAATALAELSASVVEGLTAARSTLPTLSRA